MKSTFQYFLLILTLCMGACSSEEFTEDLETGEIKKITAIIPDFIKEDSGTRTVISMGEYPNFDSFVWADGDVLGIFPNTGDQISFPIVKGGGTTCSFDGGGWALKANASYKAYFPFNSSYFHLNREALPVSMLGQRQIGNNNSDHLSNYDLLISEGVAQPDGSLLFQFSRQVSVVRLELEAPKHTTWTSVSLKSDAEFTIEKTMDLAAASPILKDPSVKSSKISLELSDVRTNVNNTRIIAYMILLPVDLTDKNLSVSITDNEGYVYTSDATIVNESKNFKANSIRWIRANNFQLDADVLNVAEAGTLSTLISVEEQTTLTELKLKGYLNGDDIAFIRGMSKLEKLDLSEVNIVAGGKVYFSQHASAFDTYGQWSEILTESTTSNNVFPDNFARNARFGSTLTSITLPTSIIKIGDYALSGCYNITSIEIPENVIEIGAGSFYNCHNLNELYIPQKVSKIGPDFIAGSFNLVINVDEQNPYFTVNDGLLYDKDMSTLVCCPGSKVGTLSIPNTVTEIANAAFNVCTRLTNIVLPETICKIGQAAFGWTGISNITIPNSVTELGAAAFINCTNLETITLSNQMKEIKGRVFENCVKLKNIYNINHIESVGFNAFSDCKELNTSLNFTSISAIKLSAFKNCNSITSINITGNNVHIEKDAFYGCSKLSSLVMTGVNIIDDYAFANSGLTSVVIPDGVGDINEGVFKNCTSLESVEMHDNIYTIGAEAFNGCTSLKDFDYPDKLESIGDCAFAGCTSFDDDEFIIPEGVTEIGVSAYAHCGTRTIIKLPTTLETIGESAFIGNGQPDIYSYSEQPPMLKGKITNGWSGIYVPKDYKETYTNSTWRVYFSKESFIEMDE